MFFFPLIVELARYANISQGDPKFSFLIWLGVQNYLKCLYLTPLEGGMNTVIDYFCNSDGCRENCFQRQDNEQFPKDVIFFPTIFV